MRRFTAIFKAIFRVGSEPEAYIIDTWAVVKTAALTQHAATKQPGLLNAVAFVDKIVTVVAGLKKPAPPADDEDDEPEQVQVPATGLAPASAAKDPVKP